MEYAKLRTYEPKPPISVYSLGPYASRAGTSADGEMQKYNRAISECVPYISASMGGCCHGLDELVEAEFAFFKNIPGRAEKLALASLAKAREQDQYEIENKALFYLLRIKLSQGDFSAVREIEKQLEAQMDKEFFLNRFTYHDIVFGWLHVQLGQSEDIAMWLKSDFEESELNSLLYGHGLELLVKVKYLYSIKNSSAALALLESLGEEYLSTDFVLGKIGKKALEALCRYQLQDREGAYRALETAWEHARPEMLVMPFVELGKDMRILAETALKDGFTGIPAPHLEDLCRDASAYAKKLYSVAEKYRVNQEIPAVNLSRRELETLKGLSQGFTREEIARNSSISVNTVKSAIRNVYSKLGAVNRADAVRIATAMNILKHEM
jgi:LuxR family maltose regulon positive regulatory protein